MTLGGATTQKIEQHHLDSTRGERTLRITIYSTYNKAQEHKVIFICVWGLQNQILYLKRLGIKDSFEPTKTFRVLGLNKPTNLAKTFKTNK